MGQMLIRNLDDAVIAALKKRAAENRTSAEEEARRALARSIDATTLAVLDGLNRASELNGTQAGPTSTEMLRWDRDRDERALFESPD